MTAKDYFRNLALHDLGISVDPKVLELRDYIKGSHITQYMVYDKTNNTIVINNNTKNLYVDKYRQIAWKLWTDFGVSYSEIPLILIQSIDDIFRNNY